MELLIIRHGLAGDKADWAKAGKDDAERPLTKEGRRKLKQEAPGLAEAFGRAGLLASSRLARALQTAELLRKALGKPPLTLTEALSPAAPPKAVLAWLSTLKQEKVTLVGHEPHLSRLIALLCTGRTAPFTELKKGQACLLEFAGPVKAGAAKLRWSLSPGQLRAL
ncbi:MAG: histidine phosphatase family protein [Elusimicrobiota bacterium]